MKVFAYVRVSTKDQNESRQVEKMRGLGIADSDMYIDKASGKNFDRPEYQALKRSLREGDLVYIDSLDRLGRDYDGIITEWKDITRNIKADVVILDNETLFDSRKFRFMGDMGKLMEDQFLSLLSYVAETERKKIRTRQAEGIAAAKAQGKHVGRPKTNEIDDTFIKYYKQFKSRKITSARAIEKIGISRAGFFRLAKQYEESVASGVLFQ